MPQRGVRRSRERLPPRPDEIKVTRLADAERRSRHVAIGVFDGVHVGHRQVIDGADTVLTFEPHPLRVLHPEAAPKLIMPFEIKRDVIEGLGVEELVVIPFDDEFSTIAAEDFCSRVLVEALGAESVSVGENFRFGAKARGDPEMLASRDEFETRVVPLVEVDGEIVSSTRVRSLVAAGEVEAATRCLGPVPARGDGRRGGRRGRKLGFPTANIVPSDDLVCPATASTRRSPTAIRPPSTSGVRPTFETGRGLLVEAYLIDFEGTFTGGRCGSRSSAGCAANGGFRASRS